MKCSIKLSEDMEEVLIVKKNFDKNIQEFIKLNGGEIRINSSQSVMLSGPYGDIWIKSQQSY